MHRTNGAGHIGHLYVNEDVATLRPPTEVPAVDLNAFQEELVNVATMNGEVLHTPEADTFTQVRDAIVTYVAAAIANAIAAGIAYLNVAQNWTKGQSGSVLALPVTAGTIAPDFTSTSNLSGQCTGNLIFSNGYTGPGLGKATWFSIRVQQNGASLYNWAFGTNWKYVGGSSAIPSQTQILNAWDTIVGQVLTDGTIEFAVRSNVA